MRIGIYSGTFDPIHKGHIAFALAALEKCDLDQVWLVVEPQPRRKSSVTPYRHRQAMAAKAAEQYDRILVDQLTPADLGLRHTPRRTLDVLDSRLLYGSRPVLLLGGEVFQNLHQWVELDELTSRASFAVGLRNGQQPAMVTPKLVHDLHVTFIDSPLPHATSSRIREELARGDLPLDLDYSVKDYVSRHRLYGYTGD